MFENRCTQPFITQQIYKFANIFFVVAAFSVISVSCVIFAWASEPADDAVCVALFVVIRLTNYTSEFYIAACPPARAQATKRKIASHTQSQMNITHAMPFNVQKKRSENQTNKQHPHVHDSLQPMCNTHTHTRFSPEYCRIDSFQTSQHTHTHIPWAIYGKQSSRIGPGGNPYMQMYREKKQ